MQKNLFWFRRDLRLHDNHGLSEALKSGNTLCCFIYDKQILDDLDRDDKRIPFINDSLIQMQEELNKHGSSLLVKYGDPIIEIPKIVKKYKIAEVYANEDYEPYGVSRDDKLSKEIKLNLFKDQVIFAKDDIVNKSKKTYVKYSAYKKNWLSKLSPEIYKSYKVPLENLVKNKQLECYDINKKKFTTKSIIKAGETGAKERLDEFADLIKNYDKERNYPALRNTSRHSVDLRFGTISIRQLVQLATAKSSNGSQVWLEELIWRDFFSQILYHYPKVENQSFKEKYTKLKYENNKKLFKLWCEGKTGYPIVDAGMRQLNTTGYMHNRLRLITATFLIKDLLIDWRWGERYFADKLLDYDMSNNNGNWQWCASTGCDAQPYFRVFNPNSQAKRFDIDATYIKEYVPELKDKDAKLIINTTAANNKKLDYYAPIVEHRQQAEKAKEMFCSI